MKNIHFVFLCILERNGLFKLTGLSTNRKPFEGNLSIGVHSKQ